MKPAPSSTLPKLAFTGLALAAAGTTSHAAVVTTLDSGVTLTPSSQNNTLSFNAATGVYVFNNTNADSLFQISYDGSGTNGNKPRLQGIAGQPATVLATGTSQQNGNKVINNVPGTVISAASGGTDTTGRSFYNGSAGNPYLSYAQDSTSQFQPGITGYAAFQILDPANAQQIDYGYMAITLNADNSVTLNRIAYENTGGPITVVPEPTSLVTSLLALGGAAGAVAARRRRTVKSLTM